MSTPPIQEELVEQLPPPELALLKAGYCKNRCQDSWNFGGIYDYFWHLYYNTGGRTAIRWNGQRLDFDDASIMLIPPFTHYDTIQEEPFNHFFLHFTAAGCFEHVRRHPYSIALPDTFKQQLISMEMPRNQNLHSAFLTCLTLWSLLQLSPEDYLPIQQPTVDPRIKIAIQLFTDNLSRHPSNREICRKLNMSIQNFTRLFRQELGVAPQQYLMGCRLRIAKDKLLHTRLSLSEIAQLTGFANRYHFSKLFKQHYTISPAAYRKHSQITQSRPHG